MSLRWWGAYCLGHVSPQTCFTLTYSWAWPWWLQMQKQKREQAAYSFWSYSLQMSSTWTTLQACHIPRAYTWPCLLTFPEKTHKFSVRLSQTMSQRVCSAYLLPRAWIYGGIPFSAPLGLCTPLLFFKFITFPIIFNNIHWDKCSTKKMEKIGIFKIFFS